MSDSLSTLGLQLSINDKLSTGQSLLSTLTEQLTTGIYSTNLIDYSASDAQKLLNISSELSEQDGFLSVITTIESRLKVYESTLTGIEDTASEAYSSIISEPTYSADKAASLKSLIEGYMDQMAYYLNQKVGERYVYSGSRYDQQPVTDITALPSPPTEVAPYLATGNTVPAYDVDYNAADPGALVPAANTNESTAIDSSSDLTYGVNSNEDGFQQIIMGLRWAYAATQDSANYETYMSRANGLLTDGISNTRATHTTSANAYNSLNNAKTLIKDNMLNLNTQASDISEIDLNEVAVKITALQSQLQASYSATAILLSLSLSDYI